MTNTDAEWMKRALAIAREAAVPGKNPIGCVIVLNGRAIGEACTGAVASETTRPVALLS